MLGWGAGTRRPSVVVVESRQWRHEVHLNGVFVCWHVVLHIGYQAQRDVKLLAHQEVVRSASCYVPHLLKFCDLQAARHEELHDLLAGQLGSAIGVNLVEDVRVEATLLVAKLQFDLLTLGRAAIRLCHTLHIISKIYLLYYYD